MTNTYIDGILLLFFTLVGVGFIFGVIYPLSMVIWYKLSGSKMTIREILRRI